MSRSPGELTNTLVLALSQCQDQVRVIQEQSARIERLQQENERLRKELQDAKKEQPAAPARAPQEDVLNQVDELFHKNVEAQAEINKLKRKLKSYKEKANGRLGIPISSPLSLPTTPLVSSSEQTTTRGIAAAEPEHDRSPPRKRARLNDTGVLHEISRNTAHSRASSTTASKKSDVEKKIAAIPMVAEDGEDYRPNMTSSRSPKSTLNKENSVYRRLGGLLNEPAPNRAPLARPSSISPSKATPPRSSMRRAPRISNIQHTSSDAQPTSSVQRPESLSSNRAAESTPESRTRPVSSTGRLSKSSRRDSEDEEPLRARSITRLSLQHFKPNPRWLSTHNMSYDDLLHGPDANRMKILAETLPKLPGQGNISDDELLLDFLGPGSEARIASLTGLAKKNLLAEARVKRVAQYFKKPRANADPGPEQDPPGFWSTDMPGTQEDQENKAKAKSMEREEVRRRYDDAIGGQGRWIFADE